MISLEVFSTSGRKGGIGHSRRADRLAKAATRRAEVTVTRRDLDQDPDGEALVSALSASVADVVLVDVPPALRVKPLISCLAKLRARGQRVVAVDGPADNIDLLVVPSFLVDADLLDRSASGLLDICWGWDHLLIDQRPNIAPRLPGAPLLVLTGGSDAVGLGSRLPQLLEARLESSTPVTWVVGPQATDPRLPETPRLRWRILRGICDLRPVIQSSSYALSVYGVSTLELLHHGVPTVTFSPYGPRDYLQLNMLEEEGLALTATDELEALERLVHLIEDPALANALAQKGASQIPQSGTEKVVDVILSLVTQY